MKKERILKKDWPEFFRKFNAEHQFRLVRVLLGEEELAVAPLLGLSYDEEEKAVKLLAVEPSPEEPARLVASLPSPRAVYLCREEGALLGLEVHSAKAPKLALFFVSSSEEAEGVRREIVEKMAYEFFLARGGEHGRDLDDWLEAERRLEELARQYV